MYGVNWTGEAEKQIIKRLIDDRNIDFVEILIDNFLLVDPDSILSYLDGTRCAFHIMNSQFLHRSDADLVEMGNLVKRLIKACSPVYVSDHIGVFQVDDTPTPRMLEIDYTTDYEHVSKKISIWQSVLNEKILFENYASVFSSGHRTQSNFYESLIKDTNCGVLFDISNAQIAEHNTGERFDNWCNIISTTNNFHVGGYEETTLKPKFLVDTHGCAISDISLKAWENIRDSKGVFTLSVERDENFDHLEWKYDIERCSNNAFA